MKNTFLKICSWFLSFVLLINILPLHSWAQVQESTEEITAVTETADTVETLQPDTSSPAYILDEITENRTEFSKEFLLSNGLHMMTVYPQAVHYASETGWAEIDNTLKIHSDGTLRNTAGVWDVQFPQQLSKDQSISVTKDGYTLSFFMAGELTSAVQQPVTPGVSVMAMDAASQVETFSITQSETVTATVEAVDTAVLRESTEYPETVPQKNASRLRYNDIYENTNVVYDLESNTLKESVILSGYRSDLRGYQYTLQIGQMQPVVEEDGTIHFYDETGETLVMVMPAPYLMDFGGAYNDEITVQLTGTGSTRTLTYLLPGQWLASQDRAWPVILDPVVEANLDRSNIEDRTVTERKVYSKDWGMNSCGYDTDTGIQRFYLKYNYLPVLTSSDVILEARVALYKEFNSSISSEVEVRSVATGWNEESITWAEKPAIGDTIEDYAMVKADGWYSWTVTDIVRGWYSGVNTGMVFKCSDAVENGTTVHFRQFYSSEYGTASYRPYLKILFRNDNGLESYWDYTSVSAGRAGTGYVNNYTGNLTWVRSDMSFDGNRMPVSINHVYNMNDVIVPTNENNTNDNNSNDTGGNYFGMGTGWRTNYHQRIYQWSVDSNYYIWEDEDGTDHYFKLENGTYKNEEGLELTLTVNGTGSRTYCIENKMGICHCFDQYGRLRYIENNQETKSTVTIEYTDTQSAQISRITDGAGRRYFFTYTNNLLSWIKFVYLGNDVYEFFVRFRYTGDQLTTVIYKGGMECYYTYNSDGILTCVQDPEGYQVDITHSTPTWDWQPYKVTGLSESHDGNPGGTLAFGYGHNETTITDYSQNKQILQFNDFGNLVTVQDNEGRAAFARFDKTSREQSTGKVNQLKASSKVQTTVNSLVKDGGFEHTSSASSWTFTSTSGVSKARTTAEAYMGQASLKLDYTAVTEKIYALGPTIQVQPGETVTVSAYIKAAAGEMTIGLRKSSSGKRYLGETVTGNGNWNRIQAVYTNTESETVTLRPAFGSEDQQVFYVDCLQVERMPAASRYNLIENGDFSFGGSPAHQWTGSGLATGDGLSTVTTPAAPHLSTNVFAITGSPTAEKHLTYTINHSGSSGDNYVFTGWALAEGAVPEHNYQDENNPREFNITLTLHYTDGTTKEAVAKFNPGCQSWQYTAGGIMAEKPYSSISLTIRYDHNANTAYFDGIGLFKETFSTSYTYDEDGNLESVVDLQKQTTTYEYDTNSNLTKVIQNNKTKMTYTYDSYHNVKTATTEGGQVYTFQYDTYGNNTKVSITENGVTMESSATYSEDGNRLVSTTDALGKTTLYGYNETTGVLDWIQYPEDTEATRTEYTYDKMYRMATAACETDTGLNLSAEYTYTGDLLTGIETASTAYGFTYGVFDLRTAVTVGDRTLATYHYTEETVNDRKYDLDRLDFGNGDSVQYEYDDKGRTTKQTFEDGDTVTYQYDNDGALAVLTDSESGIATTYYYDLIDRRMKYVESGTDYSHSVAYEYDVRNNLTKLVETINGAEHTTTYTYDADNRLTSYENGNVSGTYTYDGFGRGNTQTTKHNGTTVKTDSYGFTSHEAGKTSGQVASHTVTVGGVATQYTYTYDDNGNILTVSDGTNITSYVYDTANQLIRENNQAGGFTHVWTYDSAGNILSRMEYGYTTGSLEGVSPTDTVNYTYGDDTWGDLLTAYNGTAITYDEMGNPLSDGTWTYTWQHGRELASMSNGSTTWTFTYDASGMRTQRARAGRTDKYVYNGSLLMQMQRGNANTMAFIYDAAGRPTAISLNGTLYYYVTNLQGDITAIVDTTGATVVTYTYDAWGNILSTTGIMATTLGQYNPLRYRGYVYDQETGLYYLQSRYYDPEIGRFINADGLIATGQGLLGNNMYTYCNNNPVNCVDPTGEFLEVIIPYLIIKYIEEKTEEESREHNSKVESNPNLSTKNRIIESQNEIEGYCYMLGSEFMHYNGCEVIATHNAKCLKGIDTTLSETADTFYECNAVMMNGMLGSNPKRIGRVLSNEGIAYAGITKPSHMVMPGVYIVSYWNEYAPFKGLHTVAIYYDGSTYTAYNYKGGKNTINLSNIEDSFICGYYLGD